MMTGDFDKYGEKDIAALVKRFEEMINSSGQAYFDVEEFEDIIDFYFFKNNINKAYKAIDYASEQHPNSVVFMLRKAQLYASANKSEKALDLLRKVEVIDPFNSELFMTKGAIYSQLKKYEKAIEEYNKAIELFNKVRRMRFV